MVILLFKVKAADLGAMNTDFLNPSFVLGSASFSYTNDVIVGVVKTNPFNEIYSSTTNKMLSLRLVFAKVPLIPVLNVKAYVD